MSEELEQQICNLNSQLAEVRAENNNLKTQMVQSQAGINSLLAQLDAHKQQIQQDSQIGLNLRTNCILLDKSNKQIAEANDALKKRVCELESSAKAD